ncbi:galactonate dehydratase [Runella slithyformis]|uniref:Galactonate dehydratase n=1 Tax=Runella slithyformis (strain ATCC 29530 / DSM 19594 / LMG 11500 / NCIMB 11436 / LSU 4) TaxID=761193 RepID=A0A7U3ZJG0_RUNSL|nr:galactonate dehydratase [Runella slithyformis]AEI48345.1 Galactonate dehydratase [Runella slithyformis DSM 19594]
MKITGIETYICHAYRTNWVFVKVLTDVDGLHGVGEATLEYKEHTVAQACKELERALIGKDPHRIEEIWHSAYRDAYWRGGPVLMSALSAIEMALWDIKGKDLGVPVYQLLGGKVRESIPCYANGWFAPAKTPAEFADKAKQAVAQGFKALKWDPFGSSYLQIERRQLNEAITCVGAVYDAVKDSADIIIEGHGRFDIPTAVRVGQALGDFDILWFEEPIPPQNLEGLAEVKRRVNVPISAGERLYNRWEFRSLFELKAADFIQPDVSHAGGIMELKKIAAMAEAYHIPICPHNPSGPIANAATLQLAACVPNFYLLETMSSDVPWRKSISTEEVKFENGEMFISDKPGLGIDINIEEIKKHPFEPKELRHYKGTLTDIRPADAESYFRG